MRNSIFGFLVAAILIFGDTYSNSPSTTYGDKNTAEMVLESSVEIYAYENGTLAIGSGVVYKVGEEVFILTAAHVIGDGKGLYIMTQSDPYDDLIVETWMANVVAQDSISDWAILQPVGDFRRIKGGVSFMSLPPRVGDGVYAAGSPTGEENTVSEGIIANRNRTVPWNKDKHIVVTCNGTYGLSGGGVFDIHTGKCIGIVVRSNALSDMLYVVPVQTIINDLKELGQLSLLPA